MWITRSPRGDERGDGVVDAAAMRVVVASQDGAPLGERQVPRRLRVQIGRADGTVQVDEQACRRLEVQGRREARRHLAGEQQRTRVPAAMRRQQMPVLDEERGVVRRHVVAGVLAGDDDAVQAILGRPRLARRRARYGSVARPICPDVGSVNQTVLEPPTSGPVVTELICDPSVMVPNSPIVPLLAILPTRPSK